MTDERSKKEYGDILVELEQMQKELSKRRVQAERLGTDLQVIADLLRSTPETIVFPHELTPLGFGFENRQFANASALDLSNLREIRDAIRTTEMRRRELERQKQAYD